MQIVVASGKGGTGKTTVATSLALSLDNTSGGGLRFLDCDVEAPNAHLFLHPAVEQRENVGILIPEVDEVRCTHCGRCAEVCQFHAIAVIGERTLVFPELCHGCGSCTLVCPEKAISERLEVMGVIESGPTVAGLDFSRGLMNVGEPMAVPIIRQLKKRDMDRETVLIDAPPGTSCPVVESVRGADFCILVTEPTPFGLHDLQLMVEVLRELGIPAGVIINRDGVGDQAVEQYCVQTGMPILMRIPLDRQIGEGIARGRALVEIRPEYRDKFKQMYAQIQTMVMSGQPEMGVNR